LPAVLYGHGTDPRHIALSTRDFEHALRTDGANVLLEVHLDGESELALPKAIQRDPVRGAIEHVDLILVRRGERINVDVPITVIGDLVAGGMLDQQQTRIAVSAEATNIPSGFEVSIDGLEIGGSIHAGQVQLPAGVELTGDPEQVVVHILAQPTAEEIEAELGEGVAAEAGAEGAEAEAAAEGGAPAEGGEAAAESGSDEG
jgi:large subunit ribosomal protein L25